MAEQLSVKIYKSIKDDIENGRIDFKDFLARRRWRRNIRSVKRL